MSSRPRTGALIGNAPPPVDEATLPWPISPYGASKLCGEAYCHAFAGSFGLPVIALRFANAYGPLSDHKKGAVTMFIKRALRGEPLVITAMAPRQGTFSTSTTSASASPRRSTRSSRTKSSTSLRVRRRRSPELARLVLELTDATDAPIRDEERRRGEIERTFAEPERAAELLGFTLGTRSTLG